VSVSHQETRVSMVSGERVSRMDFIGYLIEN
jgi:hypothetical protein